MIWGLSLAQWFPHIQFICLFLPFSICALLQSIHNLFYFGDCFFFCYAVDFRWTFTTPQIWTTQRKHSFIDSSLLTLLYMQGSLPVIDNGAIFICIASQFIMLLFTLEPSLDDLLSNFYSSPRSLLWLVGFRISAFFKIMGKRSVIHLVLPTFYACVSTVNEEVPEKRRHLLLYHWPRTFIIISVRHGDIIWQRFCDILENFWYS